MSLKKLVVLSVLTCTLSISGVTSAADLSVGGQIRMGGACSMTLGNGGVVGLGNLSRKDFPGPYRDPLIEREMPLTINCQNPTKVGVDVIDNRKGTSSLGHPWTFGLGNPAIGLYTIWDVGPTQLDGREGVPLRRSKGESTWREMEYSWNDRRTASWGVGQRGGSALEREGNPVAFKTLTTTLAIYFYPEMDSTFTDAHELDGSATLELVYL
ncbi:DUF1120 domain-containing protein [Burkholderia aenigmatica]|uniref:DUF1120 domain-containing protein n=1 Tax=Burkholderia aenigmatica TaxID=2015348 RepID=UPI002656FE71|nr:DUF1120 domain-containing protein [Burkholderia aenigmatica]MDN7874850.1 DUF1120 domain-containing protein [Burkholderia aenigmatica]